MFTLRESASRVAAAFPGYDTPKTRLFQRVDTPWSRSISRSPEHKGRRLPRHSFRHPTAHAAKHGRHKERTVVRSCMRSRVGAPALTCKASPKAPQRRGGGG